MAAIRSRGNKDTELKLAAILRASRVTGWRRHYPLPGRPDFIFRRARLAIFVDGCFWHACPKHGHKPGSNRAYWLPKLRHNQQQNTDDEPDMFPAALQFVEHIRPRAVLFENIPSFASAKFEHHRRDLLARRSKLGYQPEGRILQASDHGLP
jgi:DNA mismatch endonuclease Vsr